MAPLLVRDRRLSRLPSVPSFPVRDARIMNDHKARAPHTHLQRAHMLLQLVDRERLHNKLFPCHSTLPSSTSARLLPTTSQRNRAYQAIFSPSSIFVPFPANRLNL